MEAPAEANLHFVPLADLPEEQQPRDFRKLEHPTIFVVVGPTQVGKSTFIKEALGAQLAVNIVGDGQTSRTSEPTVYTYKPVQRNDEDLSGLIPKPAYFVDTVGLGDTKAVDNDQAKRLEKEAEKKLLLLMDKLPSGSPIVVMLFSKFTEPMHSSLARSITLANKIITRYNKRVSVLGVFTFSCISVGAIPGSYKPPSGRDNLLKDYFLKAKEEKVAFITQKLDCDKSRIAFVCCDFSPWVEQLPDGSDPVESISDAFVNISVQALLMMTLSETERCSQQAQLTLKNYIKESLSTAGKGILGYAVINGAAVAVMVGAEAATAGAGLATISGAAALGGALGFGAGALVMSGPIVLISVAGVGAYYGYRALQGT